MGTKDRTEVHNEAYDAGHAALMEAQRVHGNTSGFSTGLKAYLTVWEEAIAICTCTGLGCECEVGAAGTLLSYFE